MRKAEYFKILSKNFQLFDTNNFENRNEAYFDDFYNNYPITSKKSMRDSFDIYISKEILPYIDTPCFENIFDVKNISNNHDKTIQLNNETYTIEYTTGSTGMPFPVLKSFKTRAIQSKYLINTRKKFYGIDVFNNGIYFLHSNDEDILSINLFEFNKSDINKIIKKITIEKTLWAFGTPLIFTKIAEQAILLNKSLNTMKYIELTSQPITEQNQEIITRAFPKVQFISNYGTREFWNIGFGYSNNDLTINDYYLIIDLVDAKGNIIKEPNIPGDIIITDLSNTSQFFFKYLIGDRGKYKIDELGKLKLELLDSSSKNLITGTDINGEKIFRRVMRGIYFHDYIEGFSRVLVKQKNTFSFDIYIDSTIAPHSIFESRFKYRTSLILPNSEKYNYNFIYTNNFTNTINYKEFIFLNEEGE